ncbi:MAG: PepSY domain-containing protein [Planctomycetaceae bacterium]|jgi:uncharacterized iron-regulated membrane protein|nr:PepSY domain-containing protein [Planctomycetaceae bacterium]
MIKFQTIRRVFYEIHLWLGVVSGIIVFLVCLSGALLVFREEINRFIDPGKHYVSVPANGQRMAMDELIAKVESQNPGMKVTSLTIPEKSNRTIVVSLSRPFAEGERGGFGERGAGGPGGEGSPRPEGNAGERRQRGEGGDSGSERGTRPEGNVGERRQRGEGGTGSERGTRPEGNAGERRQRGEGGTGSERGTRPEGNVGERRQRGEGDSSSERGTRPEGGFAQRGSGAPGGPGGNQGGRAGGPGGGGPGGGRGQGWYVNPYTGDVVAKPGDGANFNRFFMSMQQFHRNLWISYRIESMGPRSSLGGLIVGVATIIFVVVTLSGLVLWLPRTWKSFAKWRAWKPGFIIRLRKGGWAFTYDIHNTAGFYLLIPTLILALTGLCWSFGWYRNAASYILGEQVLNRQPAQRTEKIDPIDENAKPLPIEEMVQHLNTLIPGPGEIAIAIPNDRESPMTMQKGRVGFFALSVKDKTLWDRFRGTVIPTKHYGKTVEVERFTDKPIGSQIALSVRSLHFGGITGTSSKIVFFIACLFATSFPATGVVLWIKKLRARYNKWRNSRKTENANPKEKTLKATEK